MRLVASTSKAVLPLPPCTCQVGGQQARTLSSTSRRRKPSDVARTHSGSSSAFQRAQPSSKGMPPPSFQGRKPPDRFQNAFTDFHVPPRHVREADGGRSAESYNRMAAALAFTADAPRSMLRAGRVSAMRTNPAAAPPTRTRDSPPRMSTASDIFSASGPNNMRVGGRVDSAWGAGAVSPGVGPPRGYIGQYSRGPLQSDYSMRDAHNERVMQEKERARAAESPVLGRRNGQEVFQPQRRAEPLSEAANDFVDQQARGSHEPRRSEQADQRRANKPVGRLATSVSARVVSVAKTVEIPDYCSIDFLAEATGKSSGELQQDLKRLGLEAPLNERRDLNADEAALVVLDLGFTPVLDRDAFDIKPDPPHAEPSLQPVRPPIVCVMGHVDHGKTTLLDSLRSASVAQAEAGGITQHIGAFEVALKTLLKSTGRDKKEIAAAGEQTITFLDTPGHAAFSAMRARGAGVTDVAVLVVAADDGVKPQTQEVIDLVKDTDVALVVAITKCDKPTADVKRVESELANAGIEVEAAGGEIPCVHVSALDKKGLDVLLETVTAIAEVRDLRAEQSGVRCEARVIEANVHQGRGNVATVVITRGTLESGKWIVAGTTTARARQLVAPGGVALKKALPGQPVEISGWKSLPSAGDRVLEARSEDEATRAVRTREQRAERIKELSQIEGINAQALKMTQMYNDLRKSTAASLKRPAGENTGSLSAYSLQLRQMLVAQNRDLDDMPSNEVRLIVKADFDGTLEAIVGVLEGLRNDKAGTRIVSTGVGEITDKDVEAADAGQAVIVGFNVKPSRAASNHLKKRSNVQVISDKVIYALTEEVKNRVIAAMPKIYSTVVKGEAEVLQRFSIANAAVKGSSQGVAGCRVKSGVAEKGADVIVWRGDKQLFSGKMDTLRFKQNEVDSIQVGGECGVTIVGFNDFQSGDRLEFTKEEEVRQYL